jgi:hypothetical protein
MTDAHRRRKDKDDRERVFVADGAADFPAGSPVALISAIIDAKVAEVLVRDANLVSALGDKAQALNIKHDARDLLLEEDRQIVAGAAAIGNTAIPGITEKYKMPYPRTDQNLIADADAKYADTEAQEAQFIAVGVDPEFRKNLKDARDAFQLARDDSNSATEDHGEAVGAVEALWREISALSRQRSAMIKLKYRNNPGKLAAWAIASHLEHAPKPAVKP